MKTETAGLRLLATVMLLAACVPAMSVRTNAATKRVPAAGEPLIAPLKHPMVFYLAKGEPNSCGVGCDQWIGAEGSITSGTAARLRTFLKRNSGTRLIYFHSPGGLTTESVAIGRLLREHGMTARVARTLVQGCDSDSAECLRRKGSGQGQIARLTSVFAQCNSACVYAIVGARLREIAEEAHIGVHASKTVVVGGLPKGVHVPAQMRARFREANQQLIRRYLIEMGIQPSLLAAAEKIPSDSIRALSREELVRFNIDTRSVVESGWIYDELISKKGGIFKSIDMTEAGTAEYRRTTLRVSCLGNDQFMVGYAREVGPSENALVPLKFVAAREEFKLAPPSQPVTGINAAKRYDVRRAPVPMRAFESAAAEDRIELAPDAVEGRAGVTRLSTLGLASALSSLARRCSQEVSGSDGAALVPRHTP
jgi:hypothetical protein